MAVYLVVDEDTSCEVGEALKLIVARMRDLPARVRWRERIRIGASFIQESVIDERRIGV